VWTAGIAVLSVLYMGLVVPLGFGPDETQHAFRAYQLSLGQLFPQVVDCVKHPNLMPCRGGNHSHLLPRRRAGGRLPRSLINVFSYLYHQSHNRRGIAHRFNPTSYARLLGVDFTTTRSTYAHFENTALYSPVSYVPQIVVFWIARKVGEGVVATLFTARLAGGLVWAALVTAAVAIVPRWKWLFSLVVLVPTALAQGADISADALALGAVALATAYALWLADRGRTPSRRQLALLALLGLLIGLMKFPLVLVLVAILAIVWGVLGSGAARWRRVAAVGLPGLIAALWWDIASNAYFVPYRNVVYARRERVFVSEPRQEHYLITHVYDLPGLLWNSALHSGLFKLNQVVAQVGQMGLPEWVAIVWLVLFVLLACGSTEGSTPTGRVRAWIAVTLVAFWLATVVALYVTWTAVGARTIAGMHGRYLTLVLILALPLLAGLGRSRLVISERLTVYATMAISAAAAGALFVYTSVHYYGTAPWTAVARVSSALL
jgi:uncharacterized membrane protein